MGRLAALTPLMRLLVNFKPTAEASSDLPTRARARADIAGGELEQGLALLKQMIDDKSMSHASSIVPRVYLTLNT